MDRLIEYFEVMFYVSEVLGVILLVGYAAASITDDNRGQTAKRVLWVSIICIITGPFAVFLIAPICTYWVVKDP